MTDGRQAEIRARSGGPGEGSPEVTSAAAGEDVDRLLRWGRQRGAARVLDIATGAGRNARAFAAFTRTVVATDLTLSGLQAARTLTTEQGIGAIHFLAADPEALPFRDESFGVVTCRTQHFPQLLPVLRQVARVLRRGSSFLVEDILGHDDPELAAFILEVQRQRDPSHVRSFRQIEWTAFLRAAGLTVLDEAIMDEVRVWDDWTDRMRMSPGARTALDRFVVAAPARCHDAFQFRLDGDRILSFTDRMLLLRADKD